MKIKSLLTPIVGLSFSLLTHVNVSAVESHNVTTIEINQSSALIQTVQEIDALATTDVTKLLPAKDTYEIIMLATLKDKRPPPQEESLSESSLSKYLKKLFLS